MSLLFTPTGPKGPKPPTREQRKAAGARTNLQNVLADPRPSVLAIATAAARVGNNRSKLLNRASNTIAALEALGALEALIAPVGTDRIDKDAVRAALRDLRRKKSHLPNGYRADAERATDIAENHLVGPPNAANYTALARPAAQPAAPVAAGDPDVLLQALADKVPVPEPTERAGVADAELEAFSRAALREASNAHTRKNLAIHWFTPEVTSVVEIDSDVFELTPRDVADLLQKQVLGDFVPVRAWDATLGRELGLDEPITLQTLELGYFVLQSNTLYIGVRSGLVWVRLSNRSRFAWPVRRPDITCRELKQALGVAYIVSGDRELEDYKKIFISDLVRATAARRGPTLALSWDS